MGPYRPVRLPVLWYPTGCRWMPLGATGCHWIPPGTEVEVEEEKDEEKEEKEEEKEGKKK